MNSINGASQVFPILGWPVEQVKAPAIFNAYFAAHRMNAVVVPFRVAPCDYVSMVRALMSAPNVGGMFVAIPHKPATLEACDVVTDIARLAGAANAIFRNSSGEVVADLIDGEGFVRALERTTSDDGIDYPTSSALIVGCGGVGCAIAASLAVRGIARLGLVDSNCAVVERLSARLRLACPGVTIDTENIDEAMYDVLVNGSPLGMSAQDPLPFSVDRVKRSAVIADCGMKIEMTKLLNAANARGLRIQKGKEMLFEQAPLYLDRFGWPGVTADEFRALGAL